MTNIVIYSTKPMPGVETLLSEIDETTVKTVEYSVICITESLCYTAEINIL